MRKRERSRKRKRESNKLKKANPVCLTQIGLYCPRINTARIYLELYTIWAGSAFLRSLERRRREGGAKTNDLEGQKPGTKIKF